MPHCEVGKPAPYSLNWCRRKSLFLWFASPDTDPITGTIEPMFFFPNGAIVFDGVDCITTSSKCFVPVGTTNCYHNANFPNLQPANAMTDGYAISMGPTLANCSSNLAEDDHCHGFVSLVF